MNKKSIIPSICLHLAECQTCRCFVYELERRRRMELEAKRNKALRGRRPDPSKT